MSLRDLVADLTNVTLADGDTKSILTDNAKRAIQGNVAMHVTHPVNLAEDLTDVTLVDEDIMSILTDNANRAIQGNVTMHPRHVNHPVDLIVKFQTNASSAIWWQN